jgi:tetratricopeptide (TPR) repeat protein
VEWNFPHHHRATSFSPVDFTVQTNRDGSATVWVGEVELRHRMKWLVGLTLRPGSSCLEMSMKVFNPTPLAHSMLFWINPAVHCGPDYQVIFPPSTQWAVQHAKPEFAHWPVARETYGGVDYSRGVDISWWKNHPSPVSFFAWNHEDDWFGGYDHGKQAGVVHWADHHVVPGKKFFEWGNGPEGEMWGKVLTDDDGPYLELMAGAWSDNQPDYSWIQPGETREWQHWWYPVRELGGIKAATRDLAINLEVTNRVAWVAVNSTRLLTNLTVELLVQGTNPIVAWKTATTPDHPFSIRYDLAQLSLSPAFATNFGLRIYQHYGRRGQERLLLDYAPPTATPLPRPQPVERPRPPQDCTTPDELYLTAQRIEQLHSPSFEAAPYYQEMLRRDPGDYRANTALGIGLCHQWRWAEAEQRLQAAVTRATANYIRPKDGEAMYYLGVARAGQLPVFSLCRDGALAGTAAVRHAMEPFQKARWHAAWAGPSHLKLAELASLLGEPLEALNHIEESLIRNTRNPQALLLKSALLRRLQRLPEAREAALRAREIDPLALVDLELNRANPDSGKALSQLPDSATTLELLCAYARAGFSQEATEVARLAYHHQAYPMAQYYARFLLGDTTGRLTEQGFHPPAVPAKASSPSDPPLPGWRRAANGERAPEAFPFQPEAVEVLEAIRTRNPEATSLLGSLLYDRQPTRAIQVWEEGLALTTVRDQQALLHRNLALALAQQRGDPSNAVRHLEQAIALDADEPRFWYELDVQAEAGGFPLAERLQRMVDHQSVIAQRDDAYTRQILLHLAAGQPEPAVKLLLNHRFHNWEGSSDIRNVYVDARLQQGRALLKTGQAVEALRSFESVLELPPNLQVGRPKRDGRISAIHYHLGRALAAANRADDAKTHYAQAASTSNRELSEGRYYRGLAQLQLGQTEAAHTLFQEIVTESRAEKAAETPDYFAKFGEKKPLRVRQAEAHYLTGLGLLGLGQRKEAEAEFRQALERHPAHAGAREHLVELTAEKASAKD